MRAGLATAILLLAACPASPHRLDEYLQGTILTVEKHRLRIQMTLTPGVAVFPLLIRHIDTDADGAISEREGHAYAERVLRDLSISLNGKRLTPELISVRVPTIDAMKEGSGEIQLDFGAELSSGGRNRRLTIENRHESGISAYLVNCLAPRDPDIRIVAQERNYSQSIYRLDYVQTNARFAPMPVALWSGGLGWLGFMALFLFNRAKLERRAQ